MNSATRSLPIRPFVCPSRVLAGAGSVAHVPAELSAIGVCPGAGRVLLVVDHAVLGLGLVEPLRVALERAGFAVEAPSPVDEEPTVRLMRSLTPENRSPPVAAVLAVGGGSALDAGKLLALSLTNDIDYAIGLSGTADVVAGPPVVAVPTTAGTGAEATAVAMLWHERAKLMFVHPHLVPRVAVLDPELTRELPPPITGAAGLDAISHAVESLLSTLRTPLTETVARSALAALTTWLEPAYVTGDAQAREHMLLGAFQAGLALNASVVVGHSIAYAIAARTGLSHGVTCAMALPYCLAHARPAAEERIAEMANIVCGVPDPAELVRWLVDANATMAVPPSLEEVGIEIDALPEMAQECLVRYPRPNNPVALEAEDLERLLAHFFRGDALVAWHEAGRAAVPPHQGAST